MGSGMDRPENEIESSPDILQKRDSSFSELYTRRIYRFTAERFNSLKYLL